jgi:predicted helicase
MNQAIDAYYTALKQYGGLGVEHETALRSAMQNLLNEAGRDVGWTLVPEYLLPNGKKPDGTFLDDFRLRHGYWEAKDTNDDLEIEIRRKFALGYPADNILFEDTHRAILFQGRENRFDFDLTDRHQLHAMVRQFTSYAAPDIEKFHEAVRAFQARIPELAKGLMERIEKERTENAAFTQAFAAFHDLCRSALNPQITADTIEEMLVQHLLTERLFRTIFNSDDFTRRNVIASEIEKVIDALTRRAFNRAEFLRSLDRYYVAIENAGRSIADWNEKQSFLNQVYERFFQGFSTKQADTHGIVYTPQEIVNFMLASVEHLLQTEFSSSLSTPGVKILDPATGTGNFIVNLLKHYISRRDMRRKYAEDIFANEIMLLPYYIASLNIEHEYYTQMGEYAPFEGMCFVDTLGLGGGPQMTMLTEENTERVQREKDAPITVIIGNPPYNVGQQNENDNNKNRRYEGVDRRIRETYAKASKATLNTKLYDAYVKFFRWATDRLQGRDGIVCLVSNNSFLEQIAFDGMRKHLLDEFTTIHHLDCGGNVRKNPKLSGTTHNVFGIQVGVGITFLMRHRQGLSSPLASLPAKERGEQTHAPAPSLPSSQGEESGLRARLFYHALPLMARATEKLAELKAWGSLENVAWKELTPDAKGNWLTEGMQADFDSFLPLGTKKGKAARGETQVIFKTYSLGVSTNRDSVVYDFSWTALASRVNQFIEDYNAEVSRWARGGSPKDIDAFVRYEKVSWSRNLKRDLRTQRTLNYDNSKILTASYRPFAKRYLYFAETIIDEQGSTNRIFPTASSTEDNFAICLTAIGSDKPFMVLAMNHIPDLHFTGAGTGAQCFPFYVYDEDGTNRRENITDWALEQFRQAYSPDVTKWDIFHYVYALLHDPTYRTRYAENLKRELPRIPLSPMDAPHAFRRYVEIGKQLARLHRDYETAEEYRLQWIENRDVPFSWRIEKMKLSVTIQP